MKYSNKITVSTVVLVIAVFSLSTMAASDHEFTLNATKAHPAAKGTALINGSNMSIQARGLRANSVYTVWFVNMKPKKHETGAGSAPYMFKTDANGFGQYSAFISESPFGRWQMLMVVLHPTGDASDMKNMVGALAAKLS
jgi:hypothetical protein